jgi:uncharacterized protein
MTKRRDFLKNSLIGTAGITIGGAGLSTGISAPIDNVQRKTDWQNDPEWRKIKYGDWGGPGVSARPGPMDSLLLKDHAPRSNVVTQETFVPKAKYPAIDSHVHVVARTPEDIADWVRTMDEVGIEISVVLTGATGKAFDNYVDLLVKAYPGRFQLYCGMDFTDIDKSDYSGRVTAELVRCHNMGACGVGEISDKGSGIQGGPPLPPNKRLHPDDPRLDAFWEKCADLKMPINLHVADHPSCWTPLDVFQERTPDYQHFNLFDKDVLSFDELIARRNRTLEKHPRTIFVACHLGNQGHDLAKLGQAMDKYPNLYLDTSARDYELGRTPRASAKFLAKYRNRIVFGTDMGRQKSMFQIHWRLFETSDDYIPGRVGWRYYGLDLPPKVLKAIYRDTAKKIFNI